MSLVCREVVSISVEILRSDHKDAAFLCFFPKKVRKNLEIIDDFAGVRYQYKEIGGGGGGGGSAKLRRGVIIIRGYPDLEYR